MIDFYGDCIINNKQYFMMFANSLKYRRNILEPSKN